MKDYRATEHVTRLNNLRPGLRDAVKFIAPIVEQEDTECDKSLATQINDNVCGYMKQHANQCIRLAFVHREVVDQALGYFSLLVDNEYIEMSEIHKLVFCTRAMRKPVTDDEAEQLAAFLTYLVTMSFNEASLICGVHTYQRPTVTLFKVFGEVFTREVVDDNARPDIGVLIND